MPISGPCQCPLQLPLEDALSLFVMCSYHRLLVSEAFRNFYQYQPAPIESLVSLYLKWLLGPLGLGQLCVSYAANVNLFLNLPEAAVMSLQMVLGNLLKALYCYIGNVCQRNLL